MISTHVSRASAVVLAVGGLALLFASDAILPRLVPGFPPSGAWLGQLLAAAWLAVAAMNWVGRSALIGGIYARAQVSANAVLYFVGAASVLKATARPAAPAALWILLVVHGAFAVVYAWLLFRGPLERDLQAYRASQQAA